jgi:hypothetical protein
MLRIAVPALVGALGLANVASGHGESAPRVAAQLTPPNTEALLFRAFAQGVQIYECADGGSGPRWVFKAPEASLTDDRGNPLGTHYAGPTWESNDGSKVAGRTIASVDAPDPSAIPHLLLKAESHAGDGVFAQVRSVQRMQTAGGRAPNEGCGAKELRRQARVPYTATYYFYGDAPSAY